jgi:hypothetical protein
MRSAIISLIILFSFTASPLRAAPNVDDFLDRDLYADLETEPHASDKQITKAYAPKVKKYEENCSSILKQPKKNAP